MFGNKQRFLLGKEPRLKLTRQIFCNKVFLSYYCVLIAVLRMYHFKSIFLSIIFLFVALPLWGQSLQTESQMLALLKKDMHDTSRINIMADFAWQIRSNLPTKSYEYAQKAHKLARQINYAKGIIKSLSFMGIAMRNLGNYGIAGNYLDEALLLAQKHNMVEEEGYGNINVGNILFLEGKYQEAKSYIDRAVPIAQNHRNIKMKAYALVNLGRIYHKLKNQKESLQAFQEAIKIRQKLRDTLGIATIKYELAETYNEQKRYAEAKQYLDTIVKLAEHYQDHAMLAGSYNLLGKNALSKQNTTQARTYTEKGLSLAYSIQDKARIAALLYTMAEIEKEVKNFEKSDEYLRKYIIYQDSLHQETLKTRAEQWEFSHTLQEKETEIHREMLEIKRRDMWLLVLGASLLLAITAGIFVFLRYKQHAQKNKEIQAINHDLQESRNQAENYNTELMQLNEVLHANVEALRVSEDQQKRLNQILTENNNKLQEMNHEKDSLMGIVAHDLKAPLNRIRGILELLGLSGELNADQQQLMQMGHDIINSGSNLIRDLLDITYYEQGGTKMRWANLDWIVFMQEHTDSFVQEAQKKNIQLHLDLPTEAVESICDEDCLSRIFSNLLSNAIKFSPKDRRIFVKLQVLDNKLRLSIQDEGPGFTEEDKRKLFNKFEKLSAKPTAGEASTGLGLSIIKVLTEKMHGTIVLESEVGKGATFVLTFPKK